MQKNAKVAVGVGLIVIGIVTLLAAANDGGLQVVEVIEPVIPPTDAELLDDIHIDATDHADTDDQLEEDLNDGRNLSPEHDKMVADTVDELLGIGPSQ